eukprot:5725438-Pleurochrysis_carterae.AAC.1
MRHSSNTAINPSSSTQLLVQTCSCLATGGSSFQSTLGRVVQSGQARSQMFWAHLNEQRAICKRKFSSGKELVVAYFEDANLVRAEAAINVEKGGKAAERGAREPLRVQG